MNKQKLNPRLLIDKLAARLAVLRRYSLVIFILFVAVLYGFLLLRVNSLGNAQPSQTSIDSQVQAAAIPHIDQKVVQQLQSLQDNSVTVKALFNQARNNPFQE